MLVSPCGSQADLVFESISVSRHLVTSVSLGLCRVTRWRVRRERERERVGWMVCARRKQKAPMTKAREESVGCVTGGRKGRKGEPKSVSPLSVSVSVYVLLLPQRSKKYAPAVNSQAILCRDRDQDRPRSTPRGQSTEEGRKNKNDRDGTRTHNPLIRSQMRYPLRHAVIEHHHSHPTQQQTNHTTNNTTHHKTHTPHYTDTPPLALSHASRTPQHANKRANKRACIKPLQLHTRPRARPARTPTLRHFNISTLQQFNSPTFQLSNYPTIQ